MRNKAYKSSVRIIQKLTVRPKGGRTIAPKYATGLQSVLYFHIRAQCSRINSRQCCSDRCLQQRRLKYGLLYLTVHRDVGLQLRQTAAGAVHACVWQAVFAFNQSNLKLISLTV